MAKKKQTTYTIGEPQKKSVVQKKKVTHSIESLPKKVSKIKKRKPSTNTNQQSFKSEQSNSAPMNNAFAEAFAKAGLSAKDFTKK
jgi:hypothetical protein